MTITTNEAFAARGMDEWDIQQAIKRLQQARRRELARPDPRTFSNPADFSGWKQAGLTGPALTAAYVAQFERTHNLRPSPPAQVDAAPPTPAPLPSPPKRQTRAAPRVCRHHPLDALLNAVHDAHLAAREDARRARHHLVTT